MATSGSRVVEDADTPINASEYIVQDDLQMVRPYYFDFKCYVKKRWEGKSIIEIFSTEFPARDRSYYKQAFGDGRLRVEGHTVNEDTPLSNGMCIRHFIHRHEPPVLASRVQVLGRQGDIVAVHKPACMPVHTAGQYRKNTVLGMLQALHPELWPLHPTHRLDKPVSGLLLLATTAAAANDIRTALEGNQLQKVYVARVQGAMTPGQMVVVDVALCWDAKTNHATVAMHDGNSKGAKPAVTEVKCLWVAEDGRTSLVECRPKTGRTHQIRVHLQHLGHPIANDTQYGGRHGAPLAPRILKRPAGIEVRQEDAVVEGPFKRARLEDPAGGLPADTADTLELPPYTTSTMTSANPSPSPMDTSTPVSGPTEAAGPSGRLTPTEVMAAVRAAAGGAAVEAAAAALAAAGAAAGAGEGAGAAAGTGAGGAAGMQEPTAVEQQACSNGRQPKFRVPPECLDPLCAHCPSLPPVNYPVDLQPLWLHAASYSGPDWSFACPLPDWAAPAFCLEDAPQGTPQLFL